MTGAQRCPWWRTGRILPRIRRGASRVLVVLVMAVGILPLAASPGRAADAPTIDPIDCTLPTLFVAQGEDATQLFAETYGTTGAQFDPLGPVYGNLYNAIAYNEADGYLYAVSRQIGGPDDGSAALLRIGKDGAVQELGPIAGTPADGRFWNNGAFFGGDFYTMSYSTTELYKVDLATMSATVVNLDHSWEPSDFTPLGGYLWGISGTAMSRLDPVSGAVDTFTVPGLDAADGAGGAVFTFGNGNVGVSSSDTGVVTQISISGPGSASPDFSVVSQISGPQSLRNDGASCLPSPSQTDLSIVKTGPAEVVAGGNVVWQLTVTNHGPAASSGHTVVDQLPAGVADAAASGEYCSISSGVLTCVGGMLHAGESATITVTATAAGAVGSCLTNSATVLANEVDPAAGNNESDPVQTCLGSAPELSLVKSVSPASVSQAGAEVTYSYLVTNTGSTAVSDVAIAEEAFSGTGTLAEPDCGGVTDLAAGASLTCTAQYRVTQDDVEVGSVTNTAVATGRSGANPVTSPESSALVDIASVAALDVVKTALSPASVTTLGEAIEYSIRVTNVGNVTAREVAVIDTPSAPADASRLSAMDCTDASGTAVSSPVLALPPGAWISCSLRYRVSQADLDRGGVVRNSATATGLDPHGDPIPDVPTSTVEVPIVQSAGLSVQKSTSTTTVTVVGQEIVYVFTVTNTGTVTVSDIEVSDVVAAPSLQANLSAVRCPATSLESGESMECRAAYIVTKADLDAGALSDTVSVRGTSALGDLPRVGDTLEMATVPSSGTLPVVSG